MTSPFETALNDWLAAGDDALNPYEPGSPNHQEWEAGKAKAQELEKL